MPSVTARASSGACACYPGTGLRVPVESSNGYQVRVCSGPNVVDLQGQEGAGVLRRWSLAGREKLTQVAFQRLPFYSRRLPFVRFPPSTSHGDKICSASAIDSCSACLMTSLGTHSGKGICRDRCAPVGVCSFQTLAS